MDAANYQHRVVLATSSFRFPRQHVLFSRAKLFPDRIELSGWSTFGSHRQTIPLDHVREVKWVGDELSNRRAVLRLDDGSEVALVLRHTDMWQRLLAERLQWLRGAAGRASSGAWMLDLPPNDLIASDEDQD